MAESKTEQLKLLAIFILLFGVFSIIFEEWLGLFMGLIAIALYFINQSEIKKFSGVNQMAVYVGIICSIIGSIMQIIDILD